MPGGQLLLRRCIESPCGTHAAWRIPVRDHHENGGADRSPGAGELPFPGGSPCDHGGILKYGTVVTDGKELAEAGYEPDTPAVIIYKATWPEEKIVRCTVSTLAKSAEENGIKKTAMIFIGDVFGTREANGYEESRLYAPDFSTEFRKGTDT